MSCVLFCVGIFAGDEAMKHVLSLHFSRYYTGTR